MLEIGHLDRITAIIGERGMGKSTLTKIDAREFQRQTGGYVIGHSPNGQIGNEPDIKFYDKLEGWNGLVKGMAREPHLIHIMTRGVAEPLIDFADSLSLAIRKKAFSRVMQGRNIWFKRFNDARPAEKGTEAPPILVVIDEGTSMKRHPSNAEIERLERFLVNSRHKHVALTWSIQSPTKRQWILLEQANRFRIFRYTHEYGANSIRAAGIPTEVALYELHDLPRFAYFSLDKGSDKGGSFKVLPPP
jgi:hypothetical protein